MNAARLLAACIAIAATAVGFALFDLPQALFVSAFAALTMVVVVTDLEAFFIPDSASLGILAAGIGFLVADTAADEVGSALLEAVLRGGLAGLALYGLRIFYQRRSGIAGLGLGDVKLAAAAGPWLGWGMLPVALELAALAALIVVGLSSWRAGKRPDRHMPLPFGAFLAPAIWICAVAEHGLGWAGIGSF